MEAVKQSTLRKIDIEQTESGFVVWITYNGKRRWLLDGSLLTETGEVSIGHHPSNDIRFDTSDPRYLKLVSESGKY